MPHSPHPPAVAARLTESKRTIPHFYLRATARVDKLLELRRRLNDGAGADLGQRPGGQGGRPGPRAVPAMNVIWTPDAVRPFSSVDISVAVATERGLVTPVLRVRRAADRLRGGHDRARTSSRAATAGRLRQDELEGGAFSVTNLGMFGTEEFAAIINPPQSAILAVGAAREEPVVVDGALRSGTVMRVTLSVDHRPIDGALAAEWMKRLRLPARGPGANPGVTSAGTTIAIVRPG